MKEKTKSTPTPNTKTVYRCTSPRCTTRGAFQTLKVVQRHVTEYHASDVKTLQDIELAATGGRA